MQSDKYVRCFKKTVTRNGSSVSDYVVVANLKQGASIAPLYTIPVPSSASTTTHSPDFKLNNVGGWWSSATSPFAVTNASFFLGTYASQVPITGRTTLPYVLKHGGIIRASGYEIRTEVNQRWISLNGTYATIGDGPLSSTSSNNYTVANSYYTNSTVLGGLHPINANRVNTSYVGRTMVGIKDCDGDGLKETIYVLTTTSATQQQAYDVLRNEFGCDQTVMFDGSGSSQMKCKGTDYTISTDAVARRFPVALNIKASATAE